MPLIGPVPGATNIYTACVYGGNGITFSFPAAQLIGDLIATSQLISDLALDRDGRSTLVDEHDLLRWLRNFERCDC